MFSLANAFNVSLAGAHPCARSGDPCLETSLGMLGYAASMTTHFPLLLAALLYACAGISPSAPPEAPATHPEPQSADVPTHAPSEPVLLNLPGWSRSEAATVFENERILRFQDGSAVVELMRWWGYPETDGGVMEVAHSSTVLVGGQEVELVRTSVFQGRPAEVDVMFLRSKDWIARVACHGCSQEQLDAVVAGLGVSW